MTGQNANSVLPQQEISFKTKKQKTTGFGYMYSQSTGAVGEAFGVMGVMAKSGRMFAQNAQIEAAKARYEAAKALLDDMGVEYTPETCVPIAQAIVDQIADIR